MYHQLFHCCFLSLRCCLETTEAEVMVVAEWSHRTTDHHHHQTIERSEISPRVPFLNRVLFQCNSNVGDRGIGFEVKELAMYQ